jgi:hypothetical protein
MAMNADEFIANAKACFMPQLEKQNAEYNEKLAHKEKLLLEALSPKEKLTFEKYLRKFKRLGLWY